jgi:hypothetical protein
MSGTSKVNSIGAVRSTTRNELPRHTRAEGQRDAAPIRDARMHGSLNLSLFNCSF